MNSTSNSPNAAPDQYGISWLIKASRPVPLPHAGSARRNRWLPTTRPKEGRETGASSWWLTARLSAHRPPIGSHLRSKTDPTPHPPAHHRPRGSAHPSRVSFAHSIHREVCFRASVGRPPNAKSPPSNMQGPDWTACRAGIFCSELRPRPAGSSQSVFRNEMADDRTLPRREGERCRGRTGKFVGLLFRLERGRRLEDHRWRRDVAAHFR